MLQHGGRLRLAAREFGIGLERWLDLSTGINPLGWPVPAPPASTWARLPEPDDALEAAARAYYGTDALLAVAGSQAAIQVLPRLRGPSRVAVLSPGYAEHAHAWASAGHRVVPVSAGELQGAVPGCDVLVLIHPNNPTGARFARERLLDWHRQLGGRGGWLVVDEAFMDPTPEQSLAPLGPRTGLVVLRSLGKLFGLAGARVGFVLADSDLLAALAERLGPWTISHPARWVAAAALADGAWQETARRDLVAAGERLRDLLARHGLAPSGGCALFQWVQTPAAGDIWAGLADQGILTRLFGSPASLRFGLPGAEQDWERLDAALAGLRLDAAPGVSSTSPVA